MAGMPETSYDAEDLRLFALIYAAGSLSAAERRFSVPKSTLSRSLARLETAAGAALFDRGAKGLKPTPLGEELSTYGKRAEDAVARASDVIRGASNEPAGRLVIAASATSSRFLLSDPLSRFIATYPAVDVQLEVTGEAPDPQAEGIDLSIQVGWPTNQSLIARRVMSGPTGLYASPGTELEDPKAAVEQGRIVISARDAPQSWREAWVLQNETDELVLDSPPVASVGDPSIALDLVAAGRGLTLLPLFYAAHLEHAGKIKRVLSAWQGPYLELFAVLPPGRRQLAAVRCFMDLLIENAMRRKKEAEAVEKELDRSSSLSAPE